MADATFTSTVPTPSSPRRPWSIPAIKELPKLTSLTLASLIGGGGGTGGGGSTVFTLLITCAALLLGACSNDQLLAPSAVVMPRPVATVTCTANVSDMSVTCGGGPQAAAGKKVVGGQGVQVMLRSTNVVYDSGAHNFSFDVSIQNLTNVRLGQANSLRVFFASPPTATGGTGAITVENDSIGTFTAAGQPYYVYPGYLDPLATTLPQNWQFDVPATVTTFTFAVLISTDVLDVGGVIDWRTIDALSTPTVLAVARDADNDVMVVGRSGVSQHFDGSSWSSIAPVTPNDLNDVAAAGGGQYVAVGGSGTILVSKGKLWTPVYGNSGAGELAHVWAHDPTLFVAGGTAGRVVVGRSGSVTLSTLSSADIISVAGTGSGDTLAAFDKAGVLWYSIGGGAWTAVDSVSGFFSGTGAIAFDQLFGTRIWGYDQSGTDLLIVGNDTVYQASNTFAPYRIVTNNYGPATVLLVDRNVAPVQLKVAQLNTFAFPVVYADITIGEAGDPLSVAPIDTAVSGAYVVTGFTADADLYTFAGTSVGVPRAAYQDTQFTVWGIGDTAFVLNGSANGFRIVRGAVTPFGPLPGARALTGLSSNELYWATADSIYRYAGGTSTGEWRRTGGLNGEYIKLWSDSLSGEVVAITDSGAISARVNGTWVDNSFAATPTDIWGCDSTHVFVTLAEGAILTWDGANVGIDLSYASHGWSDPLRAVTGTSCTDVWVAGDNGALRHWDGTAWTEPMPSANNWKVIAPRGPDRVYLAGDWWTPMTVVDVTGLTTFLTPPLESQPVKGMWRLDHGELILGSSRFVLRGVP